jgi:hypothetical protein
MSDDRLLIDYLLDRLPEAETERLDELGVVDDEFAAELRRAEHDLIDAYVRGELSGDDRSGFQDHYLQKPGILDKVRFAEAWHAQETESFDVPAAVGTSTIRPAPQRQPRWPVVTEWALTAAALLMIVAAGYLLRVNFNLRRQIDAAHTDRAATERHVQELTRQLESERRAEADTLKQLEDARTALKVTPGGTTDSGKRASVVASIILLPPSRGIGRSGRPGDVMELPAVTVPRGGAGEVDVRLQLESDDFPRYRVALVAGPGTPVLWRRGALQATSQDDIRFVTLRVPVRILTARTYNLDLTGVSSVGEADLIASYVFRVVLTS